MFASSCSDAHRYANPYPQPDDDGTRAGAGYILHRAWFQLTHDETGTVLPQVRSLDLAAMAAEPFAVAWLGHATLLVHAGGRWILLDPVLSGYAAPWQGFGPKRLTGIPEGRLPRIDIVLVSHDHYDHLDSGTIARLARQPGGPPRFFAGLGLAAWFASEHGLPCTELAWWDQLRIDDIGLRFVPAMHGSGRSPWSMNATLWGGWVVEHAGRRFYFAGDTAWHPQLFSDIRERVGPPDLAAIPIGAYRPRKWMRFAHVDPQEALAVQRAVGATTAFGVHWGTFRLGEEEPYEAATDLLAASRQHPDQDFRILDIGSWLPIRPSTHPSMER